MTDATDTTAPTVEKEFDGKIGNAGDYKLELDTDGSVKISITVEKDFADVKASVATTVETNIFKIAEAIAAKTATTWDDTAIAALEKLLGIISK